MLRAPPTCRRTAPPGGRLHRDIRSPAGRDEQPAVVDVGRVVHLVPVDREHAERRRRPDGGGALVGVDDAHPHGRAGLGGDALVLDASVQRVLAAVHVQQRGDVRVGRRWPAASAGSMTIAPSSPRTTCSCDTWCEWYQYVPASVASKR